MIAFSIQMMGGIYCVLISGNIKDVAKNFDRDRNLLVISGSCIAMIPDSALVFGDTYWIYTSPSINILCSQTNSDNYVNNGSIHLTSRRKLLVD